MKEFEICYTEHLLKYVRVSAENEIEAARIFDSGNIDFGTARDFGEFGDNTINSVYPVDEKTGLTKENKS